MPGNVEGGWPKLPAYSFFGPPSCAKAEVACVRSKAKSIFPWKR